LATCIDRTGGVARYSDVVYGQHLISKVSKNFASGTGAPLPHSPITTRQYTSAQETEERSTVTAKSHAYPPVAPALVPTTTSTTVPQDQVDTILKALIEFVQAGQKIIQALTPPPTPAGPTQAPVRPAVHLNGY
jgi:hypothetical protein